MKLSIIIPAFNEKNTIPEILRRVEEVKLANIEKEIIIIDDGSTDGSREMLENLENKYKIIYHDKNQGKGVAIKDGFKTATGDIVLIQDADLECHPRNYPLLLKPILAGQADVVYGSRFFSRNFRHPSILFSLGNKFLTALFNFLSGSKLTDIWTGYKVFKIEVVRKILPQLTAERFEIEPELTARVLKNKYKIREVELFFFGHLRSKKEGKKIGIKDGLLSIWYIVKFNLFS